MASSHEKRPCSDVKDAIYDHTAEVENEILETVDMVGSAITPNQEIEKEESLKASERRDCSTNDIRPVQVSNGVLPLPTQFTATIILENLDNKIGLETEKGEGLEGSERRDSSTNNIRPVQIFNRVLPLPTQFTATVILGNLDKVGSKTEKRGSAEELGDSSTNDIPAETKKRLNTEDMLRTIIQSNSVNYEDLARYRQLRVALSQKHWKQVEDFVEKDSEALTSIIGEFSKTFFHYIVVFHEDGAIQLLQKYLGKVPPESLESVLEKEDSTGRTVLAQAAVVGNIKAVKLLAESNRSLITKSSSNEGLLPFHLAAFNGHKETVKYLLSEIKKSNKDLNLLAGSSGYRLVWFLISMNFYDIAFDLLKDETKLACDELCWRRRILETLASKPMGFKSGSRLGYWERLIYQYIPVQQESINGYPHQKQKNDMENPIQKSQNSSTKSSPFSFIGAWSQNLNIMLWKILLRRARSIQAIHDKKLMHNYSDEIVKMMCAGVPWSFEQAIDSLKGPILTAARLGILEIVQEIFKAYPSSLYFVDKNGRTVHMLSILHRHEKMFKVISQFQVIKQLKGNAIYDNYLNNILHLAAKSVPASEIPGAALQMQRELQWFKAVENYVLPTLQEERNNFDKTPREMFTEEHKELIHKGEKWMTKNASSCTIAISLIITAVFTAAFTVPGGNDDKGIPNFLHKFAFKIFVISDGLALFSSTTALLMFLGVLTASYSEEDFLISLPRKLIIGFITMFFSIASMMVAFGATIYMVFPNPWKWVIIPLGCIPVTIFAKQQFPLLLRIYYSTFAPTISQPIKNM